MTTRKEMVVPTSSGGLKVLSQDGSRHEFAGDPATWPEDYKQMKALLDIIFNEDQNVTVGGA